MLIKDFLECAKKDTSVNVCRCNMKEDEKGEFQCVAVGLLEDTELFKDVMDSKITSVRAVEYNAVCLYIE